jgi:hypothetical protein
LGKGHENTPKSKIFVTTCHYFFSTGERCCSNSNYASEKIFRIERTINPFGRNPVCDEKTALGIGGVRHAFQFEASPRLRRIDPASLYHEANLVFVGANENSLALSGDSNIDIS